MLLNGFGIFACIYSSKVLSFQYTPDYFRREKFMNFQEEDVVCSLCIGFCHFFEKAEIENYRTKLF